MILVDSSVWIDFFNNNENKATACLFDKLGVEAIGLGDLILAEVLKGFRNDKTYKQAKQLLLPLPVYQMMSAELAIQSADNYRTLRKKGITVRKSVDVWIATFCIESGIPLLFSDKGFEPFVQHLGLKPAVS